jgi:hypothetical protein
MGGRIYRSLPGMGVVEDEMVGEVVERETSSMD